MSAVLILRRLLVEHSPLTDLVSTARIVAGDVPVGPLPAIGITEISAVEHDTVARTESALITARVQVTVYAASYEQQKALLKAAQLGSGVFTGPIAGFAVRSVLRDSVGPDTGNSTVPTFEQSRDFMVTYIEPN